MRNSKAQAVIDAALVNDPAAGRVAVKSWVAKFLDTYPNATTAQLYTELTELLWEASRQGQEQRIQAAQEGAQEAAKEASL